MSHAFSPITSEARLSEAIEYVAQNSLALARTVLGYDLPIDTICFFTHSQEEYDFVLAAVQARGKVSTRLSHGLTTYVDSDFTAAGNHIRIFGVRRPDESRRQWIGYGDYPVTDYQATQEAAKNNPGVTEITSGRGKPLLQLSSPDFDVLGFIVEAEDHA